MDDYSVFGNGFLSKFFQKIKKKIHPEKFIPKENFGFILTQS